MRIQYKDNPDTIVRVEDFIKMGEYDQADWAAIDYDDLIDYIDNLKHELKK